MYVSRLKQLFLFLLVSPITVLAQIQTDRPDQTESPNVVPKGSFQIETGAMYGNEIVKRYRFGVFRNYTSIFNTTLLRFGVTDKMEFRLNWNYSEIKQRSEDDEKTKILPFDSADALLKERGKYYLGGGFTPFFIGIKYNILKKEKISLGFLGHIYLPFTASKIYRIDHLAPEFKIPFSLKVNDIWTISTQYSMSWTGTGNALNMGYTCSVGRSLGDKLGCFVEPYGFFNNEEGKEHWFNYGFTCLLQDNLQLDLTSGFRYTGFSAQFISGGISYNLLLNSGN
ncbi:MAG: hypothetical protein GC181_01550 [Bacteroidetes bacterium]|nr:hypothetical protein [Bacteroidota bacterium]